MPASSFREKRLVTKFPCFGVLYLLESKSNAAAAAASDDSVDDDVPVTVDSEGSVVDVGSDNSVDDVVVADFVADLSRITVKGGRLVLACPFLFAPVFFPAVLLMLLAISICGSGSLFLFLTMLRDSSK